MEAQSTLEVVAEISIAFMGFAGIVGALGGRRLTPERPHVWFPFWVIIEVGLGTLLVALLPMLLHHLGLPDRLVWASSSAFVAIMVICHVLFMGPRFLRAMRDPSWVRLPALERSVQLSLLLLFVSQVSNAIGVGLPQSAGGFLIGLYLLLLMSGLNFSYLLYVLLHSQGEPPAP